MKRSAGITLGFFLIAVSAFADNESVPFDSDRWEIEAEEWRTEEHLGQPSLFLKGGVAVIKDAAFTDGILEFDIAFPEDRNFVGAMWRFQGEENFEDFYMRPHQSGNPDATQYTPVFNGLSGHATIASWGRSGISTHCICHSRRARTSYGWRLARALAVGESKPGSMTSTGSK